MGLMHKVRVEKDYVEIPNSTARASETTLSLQAVGLLVDLWSYPIDKWELHKTELYKRFAKNKETSVRSAFKELVDNNYMIEVKYRKNGRNDYDYVYRSFPFTEEEKAEWIEKLTQEYGEISRLDFQDLKIRTSKTGPQNQEIINKELKKNELKKNKQTKNKNFVNKAGKIYSKDELVNIGNDFYSEFASGRYSKKQWSDILNRLTTEIVEREVKITDGRAYMKGCLEGIAYKHDLKYGKVKFDYKLHGNLPFYNWLDEIDEQEDELPW